MTFSLTELWGTMGPLARGVMLLLAAMSLASLTVAAERLWKLSRSARESTRFLALWRNAVGREGVLAASPTSGEFPHSFVAHLVAEVSRVVRPTESNRETWLEALDRTARRVIVASGVEARRGLGVLATVGSTAPFVGLFGTVIGIVNAFEMMAATGQGGLASVSAGIAEALVATALGIFVAIPALWLFNHLTQKVQRLVAELECVAEELAVAALGELRPNRGEAPPPASR